ncbi:hypothetical protein VP01_526g5 [Puccinia sorghi]|uniref:HAT C-terminal dimerisation domain-containing protein n=1 Tax=Puccinia sorghi TaxID=27349 RepID=A0A0L6UL58_9BASI|nr:hypothetical protein VP01_526g5 [Puccinia sorghi]
MKSFKVSERGAALNPMYPKMIEKIDTYQKEEWECEMLFITTLLHPTFHLNCLPMWDDILKKKENNDKLLEKTKPTKITPENIFDLFEAPETNEKTKELEFHIKNMDRLQGPRAKDPQIPLTWWKGHYLMNRSD